MEQNVLYTNPVLLDTPLFSFIFLKSSFLRDPPPLELCYLGHASAILCWTRPLQSYIVFDTPPTELHCGGHAPYRAILWWTRPLQSYIVVDIQYFVPANHCIQLQEIPRLLVARLLKAETTEVGVCVPGVQPFSQGLEVMKNGN